jgi:pyruvate-ferredoxin/flavodoxin oxidoreductase
MGSGTETLRSVAEDLNRWRTEDEESSVGVIKVRSFRPFSAEHLLAALPKATKSIAVLDRTKEPGSLEEPLFLDVAAAIQQSGRTIRMVGGRYGLGSKEFSLAMARVVFDELGESNPQNHFAIGIDDDVTHRSLFYDYGSSSRGSRNRIFEVIRQNKVKGKIRTIKGYLMMEEN